MSDDKAVFDMTCSICKKPRQLGKIPARKGQRRMRVCETCDRPASRK